METIDIPDIIEVTNRALSLVALSDTDREFLQSVIRKELEVSFLRGANAVYKKINTEDALRRQGETK